MSSARKIKARRKGQQQKEAARVRGARKPPVWPDWTGRTLFPPGAVIKYAPDLLAPTRPTLTAEAMRDLLAGISLQEPHLREIHLNTRDIAHMAANRGPMPAYSVDMARGVSRFMGVPVREDRRIPEGGAVALYGDGRAEYFPPEVRE